MKRSAMASTYSYSRIGSVEWPWSGSGLVGCFSGHVDDSRAASAGRWVGDEWPLRSAGSRRQSDGCSSADESWPLVARWNASNAGSYRSASPSSIGQYSWKQFKHVGRNWRRRLYNRYLFGVASVACRVAVAVVINRRRRRQRRGKNIEKYRIFMTAVTS